MTTIVTLQLPVLYLEFNISQERMDGIIERVQKVGDGRNIEFEILLKSAGGTFTITSASNSAMQTREEVVGTVKEASCFRLLLDCFLRRLM